MGPGVVLSLVDGKSRSAVCHHEVLEVAKPVKNLHGPAQLVVCLGQQIRFSVWGAEVARKLLEGRAHEYRRLQMLLGALSVEEVKESVLDNWPAQPPAELRPLKRLRQSGLDYPGSRRSRPGGSLSLHHRGLLAPCTLMFITCGGVNAF